MFLAYDLERVEFTRKCVHKEEPELYVACDSCCVIFVVIVHFYVVFKCPIFALGMPCKLWRFMFTVLISMRESYFMFLVTLLVFVSFI